MLNSEDGDPVISLVQTFWLAEDQRMKASRKQKDASFSPGAQQEYFDALQKKQTVFQRLSASTPLSRRGAIEMLSVALSEVHTHSLPTPEHYAPSICHPYAIEVLHRVRDFLESGGGQDAALEQDFWL